MFGVLLRSKLIQGSALRTWNCVSNIAGFIRYKLNSFLNPVMPRSRRRHHSRSRSRSHSHERDREIKRRRVDSPDNGHHKQSVSVDSDGSEGRSPSPPNGSQKSPVDKREEIDESLIDVNVTQQDMSITQEDADTTQEDATQKDSKTTEEDATQKDTAQENTTAEEDPALDVADRTQEDLDITQDDANTTQEDLDESQEDLNQTDANVSQDLDTTQEIDLTQEDLNETQEDGTKKPSSRTPRKSSKAEREKQRQQEKEERARLRQEKEELRLKEKREKEEMKQKERKEKEEQRKKEKEEREEQKRKEREEKEELKRKEREEKEEQKKKEREEKEEQKRKEREEKELKKQKEQEEKNKKQSKESVLFVNFFSRKSTSNSELKKPDVISIFKAFEVKSDMRLAETNRRKLSEEHKESLTKAIEQQDVDKSYLKDIKSGKKIGRSFATWEVTDDDVVLVEDDIGERVDEQCKAAKMRAKLLKFHENRRPAYFGTWRKKSKKVTPRRPFALDTHAFDYEVESDDDWEEEEPGESLKGSDDEEKENDPDDYEMDEFFVPHCYLSDEEIANDEDMEVTPESKKERLKILQMEFDAEMKSKTERLKPRIIGCIWESKLKDPVTDAITTFLNDRVMIVGGPIVIGKREQITKATSINKSTPSRRQLTKELIPEFLQLVHGNTNNQVFLVNEFLNYLSAKKTDIVVTKVGLCHQLKKLAKWTKCPEEGAMYNRYCWYVNEDVRNQFNLNLSLPNKWEYQSNEEGGTSAKKCLIMT